MQSKAATVEEYLTAVPEDRRQALQAVREVILDNLVGGYEEGMQYGMIGYYVPHSLYPPGYHCDPRQPLCFAGLAAQQNYLSLYLMCVYGSAEQRTQFEQAWAKTGKKLDMGRSCIRFKTIDDLALDVIGDAIRRVPAKAYIEQCERALASRKKRPAKAAGKARQKGTPAASAEGRKNE